MTDLASGLGSSSSVASARERRSYASARAVEVRAQTTRYDQDASSRQALDRLAKHLASGESPRRDVPPGYYLDVVA
jgi:hypothetical protein